MQVSPCLHPKRVYNKTLGTYHYVPCGCCDACRAGKGYKLAVRLGENMARFTHKYFITLTFSNDFLPIAFYNSDIDAFVHPYDSDYNGEVYSCSSDVVNTSLLNKDFRLSYERYGGVPVLSRRIAINFKKRLRKIFAKIYGREYLFVYIVGEYGATTFRPHYHAILCTNAPIQASVLESCVHKAWSYFDKNKQEYICEFGKIDFQRIVSKGVRNYVAQYINSNTNLPPCYSKGDFRPFYQSSPLIVADDLRYKDLNLKTMFSKCSPKTDCVSLCDNTVTDEFIPLSICNRYFPKCINFNKLVHFDRVQLYSLFEKQPFKSAQEFANNVLDSFIVSDNWLFLVKSLCVDSDRTASLNRLIRLYYMSRRVCVNASRLNVSLDLYVYRIELFWSRYELLKLQEFYELQESLLTDNFNPLSVKDLFSLYYNTDDSIKHLHYYYELFNNPTLINSIEFNPYFSNYSNLMRKIVNDTTKTKKRNDYFVSKGYSRPSFLSKFKIKKSCQVFFRV